MAKVNTEYITLAGCLTGIHIKGEYLLKMIDKSLYRQVAKKVHPDTGSDFVLGEWTHVALVWDNGNYYAYMNGIQVDSGSYTSFTNLNSVVYFGTYTDTDLQYVFNGVIDELKIYNIPLTADEVYNNYTGTTTTTTTIPGATTTSTTTIPGVEKTFGNEDESGTEFTPLESLFAGFYYTAPEEGTATSMSAYIEVTSASDVACALYNDADDSLIASTSVNTVPVQGYTWTTFNFPTGQAIVGGQDYIFICWSDGNANLRYQAETDKSRYRSSTGFTFPNWPDPGGFATGGRRHAIYVTYT